MERRQIPHQPFADCLLVTAQPIPEPTATTLEQLLVQRRQAGRARHRHQQVPADPTDQTLYFAFVVALTRPAKPVGKHVMGLQRAKHARPQSHPIAQDATDSVVLSYRIERGTLPKKLNAALCPSQNASAVSAG